jgi:UDP-N-acetylglucosamine:LPS N-acetylglucosamine transferase
MLFSPNKNIKIVLAGGGSGGHVFPIISVCEALNKYIPEFERQGLSVELIYFGANDFTLDYVKNKNISIKVISCGKGIRDFWKTIIGFFQAF